jgi:hypothetical protein
LVTATLSGPNLQGNEHGAKTSFKDRRKAATWCGRSCPRLEGRASTKGQGRSASPRWPLANVQASVKRQSELVGDEEEDGGASRGSRAAADVVDVLDACGSGPSAAAVFSYTGRRGKPLPPGLFPTSYAPPFPLLLLHSPDFGWRRRIWTGEQFPRGAAVEQGRLAGGGLYRRRLGFERGLDGGDPWHSRLGHTAHI